jgi:hypothetical protein
MKNALTFAAVGEAATGLALLNDPSVVAQPAPAVKRRPERRPHAPSKFR